MPRPGVDVVVPFVGTESELSDLGRRLAGLKLGEQDSITVVDNRRRARRGAGPGTAATPAASTPPSDTARGAGPAILAAPERRSSYFARNRGATRGHAPWLVFIDADVIAPPDLLDRYFETAPEKRTAVLAGAVRDEPVAAGGGTTVAMRFAALCQTMSQDNTASGAWPYAQTANCAVRRRAFDEAGGFEDSVRSGGDADLCFRLRAAGWTTASRARAEVTHRSRATVRALIAQKARHGAGAAWLQRRHPGSFPPRGWLGLARWSLRRELTGLRSLARGHSDAALVELLDPLLTWAFELGRHLPNHSRPRGRALP